jgi:cell division protein ZapE
VAGGPGTASPAHPVSTALASLVGTGAIADDPAQGAAAAVLDRIARALTGPSSRGLLGGLARPRKVRGVYLFGAVGRGKTMLMDLLFASADLREKRRLHFHEFMDEVHARIAAFRASPKGMDEDSDPIAAVTRPIVASTRLLCLDEFQVSDITNAMLLGRLFEKLFAGGVTLVATSNTPPDALYANGLNRQLFLPFIALLKDNADIVPLATGPDYRRLKLAGQQVFRFGTGPQVQEAMGALWLRLTGGVAGGPTEVESLGRRIPVPLAAMGAARFAFADLCEKPLGARDYLRLAHAFDTVMVENVPQFGPDHADAARRFILLIDTLYDRGIKLAASFATPLDELCRNKRVAAEFARTTSRLMEMQTSEYLEAARKDKEGSAAD